MDISTILMNGLWTALSALALGVRLTTPARYLGATFLCGFVGRVVRDVCMEWNLSPSWSTVIAAAVLAAVASAIVRRHAVAPVVLICAVLPLGASVALLHLIFALMKVSSASGEALDDASVALSANLGKVLITSLAIAVGLWAGMTLVRLIRRGAAGAVRRRVAPPPLEPVGMTR